MKKQLQWKLPFHLGSENSLQFNEQIVKNILVLIYSLIQESNNV